MMMYQENEKKNQGTLVRLELSYLAGESYVKQTKVSDSQPEHTSPSMQFRYHENSK